MNSYSSVLVTGSIAFDEIMDYPGLFENNFHPERLHQINISFALSHLERQLGGTGTNITYNIHLANAYLEEKIPVYLLGSVGKDNEEFVKFFKKNRIDISRCLIDKSLYTGTGKAITDKADNQIWGFYYGANRSAKNIDLKPFAGSHALLIISANHPEAFLHFQNQAIEYKIDYVYDPGMALTWIKDKDLSKGVKHAKYLIGNDYEIAMILKRLKLSIKDLLHKGIAVITTLGEQGVKYEEAGKVYTVQGYKAKKVVDPTGAGDAWRGGFISGLVAGWKLSDCLRLGNVMASFAIESYGTVNYKPKDEEIEKRMKQL